MLLILKKKTIYIIVNEKSNVKNKFEIGFYGIFIFKCSISSVG